MFEDVVLETSIWRLTTVPGATWSTMYICARGSLRSETGTLTRRSPIPPPAGVGAALDALAAVEIPAHRATVARPQRMNGKDAWRCRRPRDGQAVSHEPKGQSG